MKMAELVELLKDRQGDLPTEVYANRMGIRGVTLWRYYTEQRGVSINAIRKMAHYFQMQNDEEMLRALAAYALDLDVAISPN